MLGSQQPFEPAVVSGNFTKLEDQAKANKDALVPVTATNGRLGGFGGSVNSTDLNTVTTSGWYVGDTGMTNTAVDSAYSLFQVIAGSANNVIQFQHRISSGQTWRRQRVGGTWSAWQWYGGNPVRATFTASQSIAHNAIVAMTLTEATDTAGLFSVSGGNVILPSFKGRWRFDGFLAWPSNSTGGRVHALNQGSATMATNLFAADNKTAFNESWSTISAEEIFDGGSSIRYWAGQTSGAALTATGELTVTYMGPA